MRDARAGGPTRAASDAPEAVVPQGTAAGEYVIGRPLGHGAFGDVYAAHHPVIGKAAAVKVLKMRYSVDPDIVSRFLSEARAVNRVGHENVVDIFAFGQLDDGRQYYVMELLEGETLRQRLDRGPLTLDEAFTALIPVARALDAAHAAGIAHRDLKPENIFLVDRAGPCQPKLLDFGVAKLQGEVTGHRTKTGATVGTPAYMAPEQCVGGAVDARADRYAFGVVLYEALCGVRPFEADTPFALMAAHVDEAPQPLSARGLGLPQAASDWVQALLAKDPAHRPDGLTEGMRALQGAGLLRGGGEPARERSVVWVGLVALGLLGGAGLVWSQWPSSPPNPSVVITAWPSSQSGRPAAPDAGRAQVAAAPPDAAAQSVGSVDAGSVDARLADAGPMDGAVPTPAEPRAPRRRRRRAVAPPRAGAPASGGLNDLEPW